MSVIQISMNLICACYQFSFRNLVNTALSEKELKIFIKITWYCNDAIINTIQISLNKFEGSYRVFHIPNDLTMMASLVNDDIIGISQIGLNQMTVTLTKSVW